MHLHALGHASRAVCARACVCACARVRAGVDAPTWPRQPYSSSSRPSREEATDQSTASATGPQPPQQQQQQQQGAGIGDGRGHTGDDGGNSEVEGATHEVQQGGMGLQQGLVYTRPHFVASTAPAAQSALADLKRRYNQHPIRLHPHHHDERLGSLGSLGTAPVRQPPPPNKVMRQDPTPDCSLPHDYAENNGSGSSGSSGSNEAGQAGRHDGLSHKQRGPSPRAGPGGVAASPAAGGGSSSSSSSGGVGAGDGTYQSGAMTGHVNAAGPGHRSAGGINSGVGHSDDDDDTQYADVLVALGGDGFLLSQLHTHVYSGLPVFGMNRGTLGFLMNEYLEELLLERLSAAVHRELHPLRMKTVNTRGEAAYALAFNEVSVFRQTRQAAQLRVSIDGTVRINPLVSDGILVGTPAGSTAYNASAGGIMLPLDSGLLTLTPICSFRPRRLRGGVLHRRARVVFENLDPDKRPISATADFHEVRDVVRVEVEEARDISIELLYDPSQDIDEKVWQEQFF